MMSKASILAPQFRLVLEKMEAINSSAPPKAGSLQ